MPALERPTRSSKDFFTNLLEGLENPGSTHTRANAHGHHAVFLFAPAQAMEQGGNAHRTSGTQRMTQSDGSAERVYFFRIQSKVLDHGQSLGGESFIEFDPVKIVLFDAGQFAGFGIAALGPIPMISGGTPATAKPTKRASGFRSYSLIARSLASSTAPAPSDICEELPAVTLPPARKTARSFARTSAVVPGAWAFVVSDRARVSKISRSLKSG